MGSKKANTYIINFDSLVTEIILALEQVDVAAANLSDYTKLIGFELEVHLVGPPHPSISPDITTEFLANFNLPTEYHTHLLELIESTIFNILTKIMGGIKRTHRYSYKHHAGYDFIIVDEGDWRSTDNSNKANRLRALESRLRLSEDTEEVDDSSAWDRVMVEGYIDDDYERDYS